MNEQQKEMMCKVASVFGFTCANKKSVIGTIIAKAVSLLLAILFTVLRSKAKADGKVCKKRVYTVLAVLFYAGVLTSRVEIYDENPCEAEADEADFEEDFK
ncbi:MAG: hypothetical protein FWE90_00975 [Defluviitaleaceae bacterium]|nr:hypothetical protein [Defluviitaleaceae bacterium]